MNAPKISDTIRQMLQDWNAATPEQRNGALAVAARLAGRETPVGWAMRSVGCHWTHPKYPQAVVESLKRASEHHEVIRAARPVMRGR